MRFDVTINYVRQMTISTAAAQVAALVQLRTANRKSVADSFVSSGRTKCVCLAVISC